MEISSWTDRQTDPIAILSPTTIWAKINIYACCIYKQTIAGLLYKPCRAYYMWYEHITSKTKKAPGPIISFHKNHLAINVQIFMITSMSFYLTKLWDYYNYLPECVPPLEQLSTMSTYPCDCSYQESWEMWSLLYCWLGLHHILENVTIQYMRFACIYIYIL